jgi:zinc transport system substrate-binding protein
MKMAGSRRPMHKTALAALLLAPLLSGCAAAPHADVVSASYPVHYLVARLAGGDLSTALLARPGVDLHEYEPTVQDIQAIRGARLLAYHGLNVEQWVGRTLLALGGDAPKSIAAGGPAEGEALLRFSEEYGTHPAPGESDTDPHTWLDPRSYGAEASRIADALAVAFPERASAIAERAVALQADLGRLDADFHAGLAACQRHAIVTNHDAYGYMARRYNFTIHSIHGLEPGSQPEPGAVDDVIQAIKRERIPILFLEEGTDPGAVQAIQEETHVEVRTLYTLEQEPQAGHGYLDLQRENLQNLQASLGCA